MMKIISGITFGGLLILASCSQEQTEAPTATIPVTEEKEVVVTDNENVDANMIADIGISGMVCEMSCVSSVRTQLMSMAGVKSMDIDFDAEAEVNHAMVKYDDRIVTKEKMVEAIEGLNENAYKVQSFEAKAIAEGGEGEVKTTASNSSAGRVVESSSSTLEMPSVLDLFKGLL